MFDAMLLQDHIRPRNRPLLASFFSAQCNCVAENRFNMRKISGTDGTQK